MKVQCKCGGFVEDPKPQAGRFITTMRGVCGKCRTEYKITDDRSSGHGWSRTFTIVGLPTRKDYV